MILYSEDLEKNPYVWAETEKGTLEKREVVLGTYDENMMQYKIENGLEESDYVAYPQDFLEEGMKTTHDPAEGMTEEISPEALPEDGESLPEDSETLPEDAEAMPEGDALPEEGAMPEEGRETGV